MENNTPNYNSDIYDRPVPQPEMFNSGTSYGNQTTEQQEYGQPQQDYRQPQQPYAQPQYQQVKSSTYDTESPMSVSEWVGTILLTCIPCVNIILLFVWAFSTTEKKSKQNWAKATLIIVAIVIAIEIIFIACMFALGMSILGTLF